LAGERTTAVRSIDFCNGEGSEIFVLDICVTALSTVLDAVVLFGLRASFLAWVGAAAVVLDDADLAGSLGDFFSVEDAILSALAARPPPEDLAGAPAGAPFLSP